MRKMLRIKILYDLSGSTMVEVLVTISVLAAVICPLMSMFVFSQKLNAESSLEYEAMGIARQIMEEIKVLDCADAYSYSYENKMKGNAGNITAEVSVMPDDLKGIFTVEIICKRNERVLACLKGSKICSCLK